MSISSVFLFFCLSVSSKIFIENFVFRFVLLFIGVCLGLGIVFIEFLLFYL